MMAGPRRDEALCQPYSHTGSNHFVITTLYGKLSRALVHSRSNDFVPQTHDTRVSMRVRTAMDKSVFRSTCDSNLTHRILH
jgi:hypothetical protein